MSEQFVKSFLQGHRIKIDAMTRGEAKRVIVQGMIIRSNYDWPDEGREAVVDYWEGHHLYVRPPHDDVHYIYWPQDGGDGCSSWIETNTPQSKKATSLRMDDVILEQEKKELIRAAVSQVDNYQLIFEEWGFDEVFEKGVAVAVLMWGPPGTGKTIMGQAIANELGLKLEIIGSGEIWSSEPGAAERTIKEKFEAAEREGLLLLFDECDSLIADRNEVGMILGAQINALLTELENFKGVVIFTTNRLGTMDPAFERRVAVKVEFPFPTQPQRLEIWKLLIPTKAPIAKDVDFTALSHVPIAGGNIKNVVLNAARFAAFRGRKDINAECFEDAIEKEGQAIKDFEANINNKPHMVGTYAPPQRVVAQSGLRIELDKLEETKPVPKRKPTRRPSTATAKKETK